MNIKQLEKFELIPIDLLLQADPSEQLINDYVRNGLCFVAELTKQVIGSYVLLEKNKDTIELKNIVVEKEFQGQGIGKTLLLHAIEQTGKKGYKAIEVGTGNSSIGQLAFYQKCGFRIIDIEKDFFIKHYPETIIENGIQCRDMIKLKLDLQKDSFI